MTFSVWGEPAKIAPLAPHPNLEFYGRHHFSLDLLSGYLHVLLVVTHKPVLRRACSLSAAGRVPRVPGAVSSTCNKCYAFSYKTPALGDSFSRTARECHVTGKPVQRRGVCSFKN
jgi:hypothetical protein